MATDPSQPEDAGAAPAPVTPPITAREWFETLYQELRRRARGEVFRHHALTIGATTLLHEAWLRIDGRPLEITSQGEMVNYAIHVMRSIVIDHIRKRQTVRHGGEHERVPYDTLADLREMGDEQVLRIDDTLRDLTNTDPRLAELVELRFFAGLTFTDIAALRGVSLRTVQRDWDKARMLLFDALSG